MPCGDYCWIHVRWDSCLLTVLKQHLDTKKSNELHIWTTSRAFKHLIHPSTLPAAIAISRFAALKSSRAAVGVERCQPWETKQVAACFWHSCSHSALHLCCLCSSVTCNWARLLKAATQSSHQVKSHGNNVHNYYGARDKCGRKTKKTRRKHKANLGPAKYTFHTEIHLHFLTHKDYAMAWLVDVKLTTSVSELGKILGYYFLTFNHG